MEICQHCNNNVDRVCIVSYFVPGRDEQGIHNTVEVIRLCTICTELVIKGCLQIPKPDDALTLDDLIGDAYD